MLLKNRNVPSNDATKTIQAFELAVKDAACTAYTAMKTRSDALATEFNVSQESTFHLMLRKLNDYDNGLFVDGRAAIWRARIRLYRADREKEVIADSDAHADPRADGKTLHISIPAMMQWVVEFVEKYSHGVPMGLDSATLQRRTRSFRTQLSTRKDGTGVLTLDYNVEGFDMIARVDVKRESGTAAYQVKSAAERLADSAERHRPR